MDMNYVETVCKMGQGEACCRYLIVHNGLQCAKLDPGLSAMILARVLEGTFKSKGDNCEGKSLEK